MWGGKVEKVGFFQIYLLPLQPKYAFRVRMREIVRVNITK